MESMYDFFDNAVTYEEQASLFGSPGPGPEMHGFNFPDLIQAPVEAANETGSTTREVEDRGDRIVVGELASLTMSPSPISIFPSTMDFSGLVNMAVDLTQPAQENLARPTPRTYTAASAPSSYPETYLASGLHMDSTTVPDLPFAYLTQPMKTPSFAPGYPQLQPLATQTSQWPWQSVSHGATAPQGALVFRPTNARGNAPGSHQARGAPCFRPRQAPAPTPRLAPSFVFKSSQATSRAVGKDRPCKYKAAPPSQPWGVGNKQRKHMFQYSKEGVELHMDLILEPAELLSFMSGPSPNRLNLTLWIQNAPFQANHRYHHGSASSKCRYARCPDKRRSILKGFWRVAFDERASDVRGEGTPDAEDPYINAGYMHLYCFEQAFDLALLMRQSEVTGQFRIAPDTRNFPHEVGHKNRMSLVRDSRSMLDTFDEWREEQNRALDRLAQLRPEITEAAYGTPKLRRRRREDRLWFQLTKRHLELEDKGRQKARNARGGADIAKHMGDLERYLDLKEEAEKPAKLEMRHYGMMLAAGPASPMSPASPVEEVEQRVHMLQEQPHTRKRSAAAAHLVAEATSHAVTRRMSSVLAPLVASEPEHKRRRLEDLINRRVEQRLAQMQPAKSRAVERYAEKVAAKDGLVKRSTSIPS